ncbi:MAG: type II toxin-antitoxin system RelE/ParE family toxin [Treponema sp.]|jgi:putative addiction module killer protein|nr:type II toxin-antitoxin system RelE/ParE family toxin [Treponema sp.]
MKEIRQTDSFEKWFKNLKDRVGKALIIKQIDRLAKGNPGDNRFVGGISEMRIDCGPGYRVYYKDAGNEIIILLCGGDKSTQGRDIEKAKELAKEI